MENIEKKKKVGRPKGSKNKPGVKVGRPKGSLKNSKEVRNQRLSIRISEKERQIFNEFCDLDEFKNLSHREIIFKLINNFKGSQKNN